MPWPRGWPPPIQRAIDEGARLLERVRKARGNVRQWANRVHIACDTLAGVQGDCAEAEAWYWFWKIGVSLVEVATTLRGAAKVAAKAAEGATFTVEFAKELAKELKDELEELADEALPKEVKAAKDVVKDVAGTATGDAEGGKGGAPRDEVEDVLEEAAKDALGEITDRLDEIAWGGVMDCEQVVRLQSATVSFAMTKACLAARDLERVLEEIPATARRLDETIARGKRGLPTLCVPCDVTDPVRRAAQISQALDEQRNEILSLVAEGMTNREIADALYLSPLTVRTHLEHIFAKLGVRTRTAAATFAPNGNARSMSAGV